MTQSSDEDLAGLEDILLETLKSQDNESNQHNGFERLQELLVKPEVVRMRNQIANLEKKLPEVASLRKQVNNLEQKLPELLEIRDKVANLEQQLPELLEIRDKVDDLERKFIDLANQIDEPKELTKMILSLISELINRKFDEFKEEIFEVLTSIKKEEPEQDTTLSIRLIGLRKDSQ
jgi:Tfp pilus assembly protein PilO